MLSGRGTDERTWKCSSLKEYQRGPGHAEIQVQFDVGALFERAVVIYSLAVMGVLLYNGAKHYIRGRF